MYVDRIERTASPRRRESITLTSPPEAMSGATSGAAGSVTVNRRSSLADIRLSQKQLKLMRSATQHSVVIMVCFAAFLVCQGLVSYVLFYRDFDDSAHNVTLLSVGIGIGAVCLHLNTSSFLKHHSRFEVGLLRSRQKQYDTISGCQCCNVHHGCNVNQLCTYQRCCYVADLLCVWICTKCVKRYIKRKVVSKTRKSNSRARKASGVLETEYELL